MPLHSIDLRDTHSFSSFFLDYISGHESLKEFYHRAPSAEQIGAQIDEKKSFSKAHRAVLTAALYRQYGNLLSERVQKNIEALNQPSTFTVTTGHQLCCYTGPLYFVYKIVSVINACKQLATQYPNHQFVPVFWMASEDHDYEEIRSFRVFGKKYTWETNQQGAVGRFKPTGLAALADSLPGDTSFFKKAYSESNTLAEATRKIAHHLFGEQGLVVVDGDDAALKALLRPVITEDLFTHTPKQKVEEKNKALEARGYSPQIFARDINFFYLDDQLRERIEKTSNGFSLVGTSRTFTEEEIRKQIEQTPEKFSPNVVLRPLYQEMILPNLAYVGGPAEVVYWLQLKGVFDHFNVPFPMLLPRNFAAVLDEPTQKKWQKAELDIKDLFEEKNYLFNHWISRHSTAVLSAEEELKATRTLFQNLKDRAAKIDPSLIRHIDAKAHQAQKVFTSIEEKMLRAEKRKHADKLRQLEAVKDFLFPNGKPQERVDNILNFISTDPNFINTLLNTFNPFDFRFNVIEP